MRWMNDFKRNATAKTNASVTQQRAISLASRTSSVRLRRRSAAMPTEIPKITRIGDAYANSKALRGYVTGIRSRRITPVTQKTAATISWKRKVGDCRLHQRAVGSAQRAARRFALCALGFHHRGTEDTEKILRE